MANDIDKTSPHYKGEFGSIYEVNQKFPSGGVEGDYVAIDGWAHYWNADRGTWCVNAQRDSYWDELITGIINKLKLFKGATYMGVAGVSTVPEKIAGVKMYYFAKAAGTYSGFGGLQLAQGINVLYTDNGTSWSATPLLEVAQELGVSTEKVMSQKVVNTELDKKANKADMDVELGKKANKADMDVELGKKFDKESVAQESGDSEELVMSQKAVSLSLCDLSGSVNDIKIGHNIITPFSVIDFAINDNATWNKGEGYAKSIAIPIKSSSKITITANDFFNAIYSITKNLDDISNLAKVNLAEGMEPRNYIVKETSKAITVPSDGKYLVVTFVIAKEYSEYKPKEIIVDGFNILSSTKDIYDQHVAELATNKQELDIQKYGNIKSVIDSVGVFYNTNYVPYFFNGTSIVKSGDSQYKGFVFPIEYNSTYMFEGNTASGLLLENLDFSKFLEQTTLNNYVLNKTQIIKNSTAKFIFVTSTDSYISIKKIENTHNNQIKDLSFFMKEFFGSCIYDNIFNFYYDGSTIVETKDSAYKAIVIPVEANKTYYTYKSKYVNCLLCKAEPKVNSVNIEKTYPYTENTEIKTSDESKYILFTIYYTKNKYVYLGTKKMLNVVCAGDSITEFSNGFDKQKTYPEYIEDFYGFNVVNIGIGGTRFCSRVRNITSPIQNSDNAYAMLDFQNLSDAIVSRDFTLVDEATAYVKEHNKDDNTEIINRLKAIDWGKVDVLTLAFGTNDVLDTMGNYSDMDNNTMCGGINYIIKNILTKYPKISIMLIAPSHHAHNVTIPNDYNANKDNIIYDEDYVSEGGHTNKEKGELIEKVAEFNHIPCLNLYKTGGFNRYNHKQYYCGNNGYLYDGIHPWTGFEYLGRKIGAFIKAQL